MNKRLNQIYDAHSNHNIAFNQSVIKSLGLVVDKIGIKCGDIKQCCMIYSSSLRTSQLIIKLSTEKINYIKRKKGAVSLVCTFKIPTEKNNIAFFINSKITSMKEYDKEKPDLYFVTLDFINRAPDDFIDLLGSHIVKQLNKHKRAEERFILNETQHIKNFLFINGKGKRCILSEISLFSAKVILVGNIDEFSNNQKVLLIIKSEKVEGTGEMIGNISRIEVVNEKESLFAIIVKFDQEMIPPTYKMWLSEFLEVSNIKKAQIQ